MMHDMRRQALIFLAAPLAAQGVAMVADLQGGPTLDGTGLALAAEIPAGGRILLGGGARLVLISLRTGEELSIQGPASFHLDAQGRPAGPVRGMVRKNLDAGPLKAVLKPGGLAQASLTMRGPVLGPVLRAPDPAVREPKPQFAWSGPAGATFRFELRSEGGEVLARAETDQTRLEAPVQLVPGAAYTWSVEDTGPGGLRSQATVICLAPDTLAALEGLKTHRELSFARGFAYAAALQQAGLRTEARPQWRRLAALHPGDPLLQALAGGAE